MAWSHPHSSFHEAALANERVIGALLIIVCELDRPSRVMQSLGPSRSKPLIVRMHLYRKLVLGEEELNQQREARLLGRNWPLLLAEHLNYFNHGSLHRCAGQAGLVPEHFGRRQRNVRKTR